MSRTGVKVTSLDIMAALTRRYHMESLGLFPEVPVGPDENGNLRLDAVVLHRDAPDIRALGFEIKVSHADFVRDAKFHLYRQYVNALTVVCPMGMIDRTEIPEEIGLMVYSPKTGKLRYRRKPTWDMTTSTQAVCDSVLTRLAWHSDQPFVRSMLRYADLGDVQAGREELDYMGSHLSDSYQRLLRERREAARSKDGRQAMAGGAGRGHVLAGILEQAGYSVPLFGDGTINRERLLAELKGGFPTRDIRVYLSDIRGSAKRIADLLDDNEKEQK